MNLFVPWFGAFVSGLFPSLVAAALVFHAMCQGANVASLSVFASVIVFGKVTASLCGGAMIDALGRLKVMRIAAWGALAGSALSTSGRVVPVIVGLGVVGFSLGLHSILLPLQLIETQPAGRCGRATAVYQSMNSVGLLVGAGCGCLVAAGGFDPLFAQRLTLAAMLPVTGVFVGLVHVLKSDFAPIAAGVRFRRVQILPLAKAIAVMALTSAMGIGVVMGYAVFLLQEVGLAGVSANLAHVSACCVSLLASLLAAWTIGRLGRLWVLKVGSAGAALALLVLAAAFALSARFVVAGALLAYVGAFSFGPGSAAWTIAGEMLPGDIRARGMSVALLANQLVTAVLSAVFLSVAGRVGFPPVFAAFALAAVAYLVVILRPCRSPEIKLQ